VNASVCKFSIHFAFDAVDDVTFLAPVIGEVVFGVFDQADAETGILEGFPEGNSCIAFVFNRREGGPVGSLKWNR
jgi:hypothetical protein